MGGLFDHVGAEVLGGRSRLRVVCGWWVGAPAGRNCPGTIHENAYDDSLLGMVGNRSQDVSAIARGGLR
jgi:hypothetical protein